MISRYVSTWEIPWHAARDPYQLHRQLWVAVADPDGKRDWLYRLDRIRPGVDMRVILQTRAAPGPVAGLSLLTCRRVETALVAGQETGFRWLAKPIRRRKSREDTIPAADRPAWVSEMLAGGFVALDVAEHSALTIRTVHPRGGAHTHVVVDFCGALRVEDPARAEEMVLYGRGRGKMWGCGMLLLEGING